MNNARRTSIFILLAAILLGSCAGQAPEPSTPDVNAILTQSVGTFAAAYFETQTAMVTPATPTPLDTPTSIPTTTPLPLPTLATPTYIYYTAIVYPTITATGTQYTPTVNPSTLGYGCNNLGLINNLGVSPSSTLEPGDDFTVTWQVANTGTCDWTFGYRVIPVGGANLSEEPVRLNNPPVPPNEWRRISIRMTAPDHVGTYTQYWRLSDGAGHAFGATLGVTITVEASYP